MLLNASKKRIFLVTLLVMLASLLGGCFSSSSDIDWNDAKLQWYSYEEGIAQLKQNRQRGLLVIYAPWCSTCKQYSHLFFQPAVVDALQDVVLIRVDKDQRPDLSQKYNIDGEYVPRTFALNARGKVIRELNSNNQRWLHYLPAGNTNTLISFVKALKTYRY